MRIFELRNILKKNPGLNRIQIHDLCDTTAVLDKLLLRSTVHLNEWSTSKKVLFFGP